MKRLQGYKYELRPNGEQQRLMRRFAGSCRFVYNKADSFGQPPLRSAMALRGEATIR